MARTRLFIYSAAHFAVDFSCALLLLGRIRPGPGDALLCLLLYNFCAFALQMPVGLLADRLDKNHAVAALGCGACALAWLIPGLGGAVCAGVGNALFHVGGGLDTLNRSASRCGALGIFVSPGALGIFLGGLLAGGGAATSALAAGGVLLAGGLIFRLCRASGNAPVSLALSGRSAAPAALICLALVVVLRSYLGLAAQFPWKAGYAVPLVAALVLGKALGGLLADRFGLRRTAAVSLGTAALLFLLADVPAAGIAGVFLFNMTMPLTLWGAAGLLPGAKGFAFGLLTFGLFLGFLPVFLGISLPLAGKYLYALGALVSLPPLLFGLGRVKP
ncbi:hypothetical protein [Lawsonibacter faecis]|uniref:Uncharacterized protein n=1 Tax=Lawsonibacter faecis TaxID=2763052 RepID=A0A8J6JGM5_9FIRM|nr:hypothetical protein [Lawsonibacter faecis]MBC5735743.1 hypothetical protein [Lawsonibacter faecis]